ncbi:MAG: hypothetical protein JRJ37_11545, partial [Deltaproteobacteria bacterium]|nr:hypothetical protein [Deltaproteobacteria bacterium]
SLYFQGTNSPAYGEEVYQKTNIDPRDAYLNIEALCGCEGLPNKFMNEYMIPKEEYVKTKLTKDDLYIDLSELCSEEIPFTLVIPRKFVKTKIDYEEDRKSGAAEYMSEDPTSLEIKSKK